MESRNHCAYNQTRECFLGLEVAVANFSLSSLNDRIARLALKSGEGLWLTPFRGIPETELRVPLDLIYLDRDCRVIDMVESFPAFRVTPSHAQRRQRAGLAGPLHLFVADPAGRPVGALRG